MKKFLVRIAFIIIMIPFVFINEGCKKGSGDPGISFRSREARVAGDWKVKSFTSSENSTVTTTLGDVYQREVQNDFDGTTLTVTENDISFGEVDVKEFTAALNFSFSKDGSWTSKQTGSRSEVDTVSIYDLNSGNSFDYLRTTEYQTAKDESGKWDFLSGTGDAKKKEFMYLEIVKSSEQTTENSSYSAIDAGAPAQTNTVNVIVLTKDFDSGTNVWQITTLKNKQMSIQSAYDYHTAETFNNDPSDQEVDLTGSASIELVLE